MYVTLKDACYAYDGAFSLVIKLIGGGMTLDEYTPVFAREVSRLPYQYEEPKEQTDGSKNSD